jgi:amidophosphoribosyltransferase
VYFASAAPPIIGPDPYGIDLPTEAELIAANLSVKQIEKHIGADGLFYGNIEDLRKAVRYGNANIRTFSEGCFTKKYPTPEVTPALLRRLGSSRNEVRTRLDTLDDSDSEDERSKTLTLL